MDRREYQKAYRLATAEKRQADQRDYRESHRDELRDYHRDYWSKNKDKKAAKGSRHYQNRKKHIQAKQRQRISNNVQVRIASILRSRLGVAIRGGQKGGSAISDLGCSVAEFQRYIELQFDSGMSWNNWGRETWHIDHIRPLNTFDLSDPDQVSIACHFSNMQPLWAKENLSKSCRPFAFPPQENWIMSNEAGDLWGGMRIPIILVSGPVNSGKTLFGLTIDGNTRKSSTEVSPTTILWDQEGSADSYVGGLNFEHKDVRAAVGAGVHLQKFPAEPDCPKWRKVLLETADVNDHPSASMFRAWYLSLLKVPQGKYRVGICDTFTPIQDGLIEWVKRHPDAFGYTYAQFDKAASMFMWPVLKSVLAHILAADCRLRFDTFVINVHLKNEWSSGGKTGKLVAEGLDVLEKLATLHLRLDRSPKEQGKEAPRVPSALTVPPFGKSRLVRFSADGSDQPILPPRMPEATPAAIRGYILKPPDFAKLAVAERLPDQSMGEDDKRRMDAFVSENNRVTAEANLSALELARQAAQAAGGYPQARPLTAAAPATTEPVNGQPEPDAQSAPAATPMTQTQAAELMKLLKSLFKSGAEATAYMASIGHPHPQAMGESDAADAIIKLYALKAERMAASNKTPALDPTGASTSDAKVTQEQRNAIRSLTETHYGSNAPAANNEWLASLGFSSPMSLSFAQAQQRIVAIESLIEKAKAAGNQTIDAPFDPDDPNRRF